MSIIKRQERINMSAKKIVYSLIIFFISLLVTSCKESPSYQDVVMFHQAIEGHDIDKVRLFITRFKNICRFDFDYLGLKSTNPVLVAIAIDDFPILKLVVENGSDVNYQDKANGYFALQIAIEKNNSNVIQYLLQKKADPLLYDKHNANVLHDLALINRNIQILKLFETSIEKLVNQRTNNGYTPLYLALLEGDIEKGHTVNRNEDIVFYFLDHGADLKLVIGVKPDVFAKLIETKENNYVTRIFSYTKEKIPNSSIDNMDYLQIAVSYQNWEMVPVFIPLVNVNNRDSWGRTALHLASYFNNAQIIEFLVKSGYDKSLVDSDGNTAYSTYIKQHTHPDPIIIKLLEL